MKPSDMNGQPIHIGDNAVIAEGGIVIPVKVLNILPPTRSSPIAVRVESKHFVTEVRPKEVLITNNQLDYFKENYPELIV